MADATRTFDLVSRDAQVQLTEFVEDLNLALTQDDVENWAEQLGITKTSKALKLTFPVPVSAAGYEEFKGNLKYRTLFEKSVEMVKKTYQDGVVELASVVEAPDFIGWADEPTRMAKAARSLTNEIIAGLVEGGTSAVCWDGQFFFDTDHPVNVFDSTAGTFVNVYTGGGTTLTLANLKLAKERIRKIKAPNGKPLGLRMTHLMVGPALEEDGKDLLENDMIIDAVGSSFASVDNRHKGTVKLVVCDELTSDTAWYALALNKPGMRPWALQTGGAPDIMVLDKSSALYETQRKVGVDAMLEAAGALLLPHCITKYAGA